MKLNSLLAGLAAFGLLTGNSSAQSQDARSAAASVQQDLQQALTELAEIQKEIAAEKIPLSRRLTAAEEALQTARKNYETTQRSRDNQVVDLNVLKSEVKKRQDEVDYLGTLLAEYVRVFETRLHISETARYRTEISAAKLAGENPDLAMADRIERQLGMLELSVKRLDGLLGGERFAGKALVPGGRLESGQFALLGPVGLFASEDSAAAGLAEDIANSAEPTVVAAGEDGAAAIQTLIRSGAGELPLDTTLGNATKIAATKEPTLDHIRKGGPVMYPILALGVVAMLIGLVKWLQLAGIRVATPRDLQIILDRLNRGDDKAAMEHASAIKGPAGELLKAAVAHADEKKEFVEEVLYEKMLNTKPRLERMLPFVALGAATAPLLGLLGTVTGMITTFNMISVFGTGDPKTLSGGISEALITTEYGLIVAIPCLLVHAVLSRKVKAILGSMEQTTVAFINGAPDRAGENPAARPEPPAEPFTGKPQPATA